MKFIKSMKRVGLLALTVAPGVAFAQDGGGIDVSTAVTAIAGIGAAVGAVGLAKFAPAAIAVAYKWVKATIFG